MACMIEMFSIARSATDAYQCEMEASAHRELLSTTKQCQGRVTISGYLNERYNRTLHNWKQHDNEIDNKVSGASSKRRMTESLGCNY